METVVIFHSQGQAIFANLSLPNVDAPGIIISHGLEGSKDADKWLLLASGSTMLVSPVSDSITGAVVRVERGVKETFSLN